MLTLLALIGVLSGASVPAHQSGGEAPLTIAVDVDLVVFNVTVTDDKGRRVSGLKPDDFAVSEDHRAQTRLVIFRAIPLATERFAT